jgi:hypothetical protein
VDSHFYEFIEAKTANVPLTPISQLFLFFLSSPDSTRACLRVFKFSATQQGLIRHLDSFNLKVLQAHPILQRFQILLPLFSLIKEMINCQCLLRGR